MGALDYREYYTKADYAQWAGDWELIDGVAYAMAPSPLVIVVSIISVTTNSASGESHFGAFDDTAVGSGGDSDCCAVVGASVGGGGRWISAAQRCGSRDWT